jgi:SM-20-related protein
LYLNQDWQEKDKGNLSIYPSRGIQQDILAIAGRLVFFKSDEMEPEVNPSNTKERNSIACWLKN